ncbi:MAG TPA: magnesium transporter, partial [Novosphingobium sp.]|nr:magnesium transporter [Novosphingobium sp.]HPZ47648.1 magnesium transporter [Novosphingobium sp.]HQE00938.1 magnesium transporter [Novosphingobium sp.]
MTPEELATAELQSAAPAAEPVRESESLDEENTLKKNFVRRVSEALEAGENERVYELVEPLHPADIADLFELLDADERP